jgi:outer membrane protein assembly factor BamA
MHILLRYVLLAILAFPTIAAAQWGSSAVFPDTPTESLVVEDIVIRGCRTSIMEEILQILPVQPGDVVDSDNLQAICNQIRLLYSTHGYPDVRCVSKAAVDDEGLVTLDISVKEEPR